MYENILITSLKNTQQLFFYRLGRKESYFITDGFTSVHCGSLHSEGVQKGMNMAVLGTKLSFL